MMAGLPVPRLGLCVRGLAFAYGRRAILSGIDLDLAPGDVLSLLGSNGAGKSTLLRLLMGFERPQAGSVLLDGEPLHAQGRQAVAQRLAYVPQAHAALFPYRVQDVVLMGRIPARGLFHAARPQDHELALQAMQRLGIAHLALRPYTEVSGGERQMVLIARALAQGARILVLDEPTAGLDYGNQMRLLEHMRGLAHQGYAVLQTTHHPDHALIASTRVVLLEGGRIVDEGRPCDVITPASMRLLYGIEVTAFQSPQGHKAFYPTAAHMPP